MRLIIFIIHVILFNTVLVAQEDLINTKQSFVSFDKAKLTLGIGGEIGGNSLFLYQGTSPMESEIVDPLYFTGSVLFDLHSPKSIVGLAFGLNFDWRNFTYSGISGSTFSYNDIDMQYFEIPVYLKMRLGGKFSKSNLVLFGGGSFDLPFMYRDSSTLTYEVIHKDKAILQSGFSAVGGLAWQLNFRGKMRDDFSYSIYETSTNEKVLDIIFPRIWIYVKANKSLYNLYNTSYETSIFSDYNNEDLDFSDIRFSLGFMYFIGGNQKNEVQ